MTKKYHIYAYKHYWPADGIDEYDVPVPYTKDKRAYVIEARTEKEAVSKAEAEYGTGEHVSPDGQYIPNSDGSWTLMGVTKVEL